MIRPATSSSTIMQKLDINTVAQGINRYLSVLGTDESAFISLIEKTFKTGKAQHGLCLIQKGNNKLFGCFRKSIIARRDCILRPNVL